MALHQSGQAPLQIKNLPAQLIDPLGQQAQGGAGSLPDGILHAVVILTIVELRASSDQGRSLQAGSSNASTRRASK
ncbi:hypothetical protein CP981_34610 [Streptomyces platensis]|uniref:Uncharacterized protein n=1 Tax=Streptomyces platensis TaxID=58346 RepID=A0AAE6TQH8_STRPT|nr:hypothetical protein [Streptomyces platensis]QEV56057.1 hypothetical protein CP981_34610 [Streptomyces platensis]